MRKNLPDYTDGCFCVFGYGQGRLTCFHAPPVISERRCPILLVCRGSNFVRSKQRRLLKTVRVEVCMEELEPTSIESKMNDKEIQEDATQGDWHKDKFVEWHVYSTVFLSGISQI